jgi:hypothetical protein
MSVHDFLERTRLPLLIIVLIPVAAVLYLIFGANENSPTPAATAPPSTSVQTTQSALPPVSLSLNDPSSLPQSVTAAELVPFSFTLQNTSGQDENYQYKVSVRWSTGEDDVIDENTLSLAAGASTQVQEQLKFEIATETAEVIFELPQTGQSFEFALPATN